MTPAEMREAVLQKVEIFTLGMSRDRVKMLIAAIRAIPIPDTTAADEAMEKAREALEPFARAISAVENYDPLAPDEMAALRASFDYWTSQLGMNNDEVVTRDSVRVSDLRRARVVLAAIDAAKAKGGG